MEMAGNRKRLPLAGWFKPRPPGEFNMGVIKKLINQLRRTENIMSQLDTDVAALTGAVATLTDVVTSAISALGAIVDTSSDQAAVEAANAAIADLTTKLAAALAPAPVEAPPVDEPPADPAAA